MITKRGRPVAKLIPYVQPSRKKGLAGSVLKESGDPADEILVATARYHGAVLISKDQPIRRYAHVQSVW